MTAHPHNQSLPISLQCITSWIKEVLSHNKENETISCFGFLMKVNRNKMNNLQLVSSFEFSLSKSRLFETCVVLLQCTGLLHHRNGAWWECGSTPQSPMACEMCGSWCLCCGIIDTPCWRPKPILLEPCPYNRIHLVLLSHCPHLWLFWQNLAHLNQMVQTGKLREKIKRKLRVVTLTTIQDSTMRNMMNCEERKCSSERAF